MADDLTTALTQKALNRLRELWDEPTARRKLGLPTSDVYQVAGDNLLVPAPPQYQPEPEAVGGDVGRALRHMLKIAPALQGRVKKVQVGPTNDMVSYIHDSNKEFGTNWHRLAPCGSLHATQPTWYAGNRGSLSY